MKRLLLLSIVSLGICSFANAQSAKTAQDKKATPSQPAVVNAAADVASPAPAAVVKHDAKKSGKQETVVATNAAGSRSASTKTPAEITKKKEQAKAAEQKAAKKAN